VLENYNSRILRQRGATECSAKLGKSGREILEMSEKPMKQSNKQICTFQWWKHFKDGLKSDLW